MSRLKVGMTTGQADRSAYAKKQKEVLKTSGVNTRSKTKPEKPKGDHSTTEGGSLPDNEDITEILSVHTGLENSGSMCFENAVLQALASCPGVLLWAGSIMKKPMKRWENDEDSLLGTCVLRDIRRMMGNSQIRGGKIRSRRVVFRNLHSNDTVRERGTCTGIGGRGKQDAHEFLQLFVFSLYRLEGLCQSKHAIRKSNIASLSDALSDTTHVTRTCSLCKRATLTQDIWNILTFFRFPPALRNYWTVSTKLPRRRFSAGETWWVMKNVYGKWICLNNQELWPLPTHSCSI